MSLDAETCYRAMRARDPRFDGMFYVAVSTTGVYCRPICPARTPRRDRCTFYARPAEAERAGYRACFRCRPEIAPGGAAVDALPRLVRRAVARIESGYLQDHSIEDLAAELGVSARHLRRAMEAELGVSPTELAHSRRLALAKQMLHDTRLPVTEVAFASGFSSVRRFNAAFFERFGRPPSAVRRSLVPTRTACEGIRVRLDYRPPFDFEALLGFYRHRAIEGVESIDGARYCRTIRVGSHAGSFSLRPSASSRSLEAELSVELASVLPIVVSTLRAAFDLDARPDVIDAQLASDPLLAPSVRARPGLRVAGAVDGFELGVRAVLGQRISVAAARTLAGRLVRAFGDSLPEAASPHGVSRLFPPASRIAAASKAELEAIGIGSPASGPIVALARAIDSGELDLSPGADPERALAAMAAIPGIGSWTRAYVSLRALRDPDAFPAADLVLRRVMGVSTERQAEALARRWTPWRGYAAFHLWSLHSETKGDPR